MSIFFPKNDIFDELFLDLTESIKDMVELFSEFSKDFQNIEKYTKKATIIEEQADSITHKIMNELQTAFITPYDREDLHALVMQLDDVVDDLESVIQSFYIYNISDTRECVGDFAELYTEAAENLSKLIQACFGTKKNTKDINIMKIIIAIHTIEGQGDDLYMKNMRSLFTQEKDPMEVMKWRVAIESMESAMDRFEKTASIVEGLKLKAS